MTKILVIEDNHLTRDNLHEILDLEGFEVLIAVDGEQGCNLAQSHIPDLIICDIMMPLLDGYGVLGKLTQYETTASIPFVFLTAKATHSDFRQGMNLGANDYLTKPFSPADVIKAVRTQLNKKARVNQTYTNQIHQLEKNIEQLANHNPLTRLPNQHALTLRLDEFEDQLSPISLLAISIDQFSLLSSTLNSFNIDQLIQAVAHRLSHAFSTTTAFPTTGEVFHTHDNQFVVLIHHVNIYTCIDDIARAILADLATAYALPLVNLSATASIGIATTLNGPVVSTHCSALDCLVQDAVTAQYCAQQKGGNTYCLYRQDMTLSATTRLSLANALHYALENGEFEVYYQPQVALSNQHVVGVEALLRWNSRQFGSVSPAQFIPIAEENGLIHDVGYWVLWTACCQAKAWQETQAEPMSVAVNVSPVQLSSPNLVDMVRTVLEKSALEPSLLHLEITETAFVKQQEIALRNLRGLRKIGVKIAIDDFGTGYSGLGYLSTFPCHVLKIDRAFIHNIHKHPTNQHIVSAVLNMCRDLNLKVVAEGVETELELAYLKDHSCDLVQGYIYARPMPVDVVTVFVDQMGRSSD